MALRMVKELMLQKGKRLMQFNSSWLLNKVQSIKSIN